MSIFKNIGKTLKKAAPLIGAGIGFYFGGPMGAGLGSGIGTWLRGSAEDALLAGALGYAGGSMAQVTFRSMVKQLQWVLLLLVQQEPRVLDLRQPEVLQFLTQPLVWTLD